MNKLTLKSKRIKNMMNLNTKTSLAFFLIIISSFYSSASQARDINVEQHNASEARDQYNKAKANYENTSKQITTLEQNIAEQQAKLNELKNKQLNEKTNLDESKLDLDNKTEILNKAWEERNR
jgi:biopolymer transport protein ExbB/TolQ